MGACLVCTRALGKRCRGLMLVGCICLECELIRSLGTFGGGTMAVDVRMLLVVISWLY